MDRPSAPTATAALTRAVRRRTAADTALVEAMYAADRSGVSRNEICRRVAGTYARQTTLDLLNTASLHTRATAALRQAGFLVDEQVVVERRRSRIRLRLVDAESSPGARRFATDVHQALLEAGLTLRRRRGDADPVEVLACGGVTEIGHRSTPSGGVGGSDHGGRPHPRHAGADIRHP